MSHHAPTAREREQPQGDEEASSELKLGQFQNVPSLSLSEARLLINTVMKHRKETREVKETEMLIKTTEYLDHFARFRDKENIEAVERLLSMHPDLELFERSQLGTLCCGSAEEAKTLMPSLSKKKTDEELQELLTEINDLRGYVE